MFLSGLALVVLKRPCVTNGVLETLITAFVSLQLFEENFILTQIENQV